MSGNIRVFAAQLFPNQVGLAMDDMFNLSYYDGIREHEQTSLT